MLKVSVSQLEGAQLDWAVATALGKAPSIVKRHSFLEDVAKEYCVIPNHRATMCELAEDFIDHNPSSNWGIAGLIIERERICLTCGAGFRSDTVWGFLWEAELGHVWVHGDTPLIAAMRAFVASKLGDEVEIPHGA